MSVLNIYNSEHQSVDGTPQKNIIGMDDYFDRVFGVELQPILHITWSKSMRMNLNLRWHCRFTDQEVKVYTEKGNLVVEGKKAQLDDREYVHRGMAQRSFTHLVHL